MTTLALPSYNIYVGDIWEIFQQYIDNNQYRKIFIIVDENTMRDCLPILLEKGALENYDIIETTSGEKHKNINTCQNIWQEMMKNEGGRSDLTINLGGGVIGDMGGFCATTFKRGMDFIQIPTTLLSQVDASIGGKLGIDFQGIKNSIGLFKNPKAVFIAPEFLQTLPPRQLRSGFAEMIKHSLIADGKEWGKLQKVASLEGFDCMPFLIPSLKVKQRIVEADPFEKGLRKALNFGHTIGHAIEALALVSSAPLLHGEAIAAGMLCEAWLSCQTGKLTKNELKEIEQFIGHHYDPYPIAADSLPTLINYMKQDKKNENQRINFTMLQSTGKALINQYCSETLIRQSLEYYNSLS